MISTIDRVEEKHYAAEGVVSPGGWCCSCCCWCWFNIFGFSIF